MTYFASKFPPRSIDSSRHSAQLPNIPLASVFTVCDHVVQCDVPREKSTSILLITGRLVLK